jgi:aldehyde dehydrogenase (NAD+)
MKQMFIGGRWLPARDGRSLPVVDPADGQAFDEIARGTAHEVDLAVAAARASLSGPWGRLNATERGRILVKIGQAVLDHAPELAALEARDTGKPMTTARNDIQVLGRYFEFYGTAADKIHGETIPFLAGHQVSLLREPLGVTKWARWCSRLQPGTR